MPNVFEYVKLETLKQRKNCTTLSFRSACVRTCQHTHTHMHAHIHRHAHTDAHRHRHRHKHKHTHTHAHTHTHRHASTHACVCAHVRARTQRTPPFYDVILLLPTAAMPGALPPSVRPVLGLGPACASPPIPTMPAPCFFIQEFLPDFLVVAPDLAA